MMADQPPQNGQISPVIPVDQIKQEKDEARKNAPTIDEGGSLRFDDDDGEHDAPVRRIFSKLIFFCIKKVILFL